MISIIVGLGNPGQQYEKTRHNAGFLFVDSLAEQCSCDWSKTLQFQGLVGECRIAQQKVMLFKPQTFMNRSGQAVGSLLRYYKLLPEQVLVVHDELDFAPGLIRLKQDGGHGGHNGLKDIIAHLSSKNFSRLRLGIGRPPTGMAVADYVLSAPSKTEGELIFSAIEKGKKSVDDIVVGNMEIAMNDINR